MPFFTMRNMMILALVQTGLLLGTVVVASVARKWEAAFEWRPIPLGFGALTTYGWLGLLLPAVWFAVAVHALRFEWAAERIELCIVLAGLAILAVFLVVAWFGAVVPLYHITLPRHF